MPADRDMDRLLDRSAFPGLALDARAAGASFVGEARFNGGLAAAHWPRAALQALLPDDIALAANVSTTPDLHPLIFIFGEQLEGTILFGGMSIPLGVRYTEFGLAIPYVVYRDEPSLHTYVPRMYSSFFPPVRDGNLHYGFGKAEATVAWHGRIATLSTPDGGLLWHAAVEPTGPWCRTVHETPPGLAALRAALALPILGRKQGGRYVRSYFDLGFSEAQVRPLRCAISIDTALIEGLPLQRCVAVPDGAFEVRGMVWHLSWPEPLG
jgi:hypothetical protein